MTAGQAFAHPWMDNTTDESKELSPDFISTITDFAKSTMLRKVSLL